MIRRQKFLVTGLVVGAAALLILWNTSAQSATPALGVAEAKRDAPRLQGQAVAVRGTVVEGSIETNGSVVERFVLADSLEQLLVEFGKTPPDNFGPKEVVVYGVVEHSAEGRIVLHAQSLQVGCSSKY